MLFLERPDPSGGDAPSIQTFRDSVRGLAYDANDRWDGVAHFDHDYVPLTDAFIHIHWAHNGTAISGNWAATFSSTYAKGHNQAPYAASKDLSFSVSTPNTTAVPRYQHMITELQWSIAGGDATRHILADLEVDGLIKGSLLMTAIPTIVGGNFFLDRIDLHYQSTNMGTKQKSPPFNV
jgi:hypothetical protein